MANKVFLNDFALTVSNYKEEKVKSKQSDKQLMVVSFEFKVRGGEEYHVVTKFLYENVFDINIPDEQLNFRGKINQYSTSYTNFSDENSISDFFLELVEVE
ncbi:MAG: DUF3219 family protein [Niallia sp.]|nr:Protein of uncharacterised function (DUF3219) [Mycobacteroides abscessus subsp. abscessus]HEO8420343.1 DUF3219 family protein [Yersinia enterocolitica]HEO8422882.1 DUF3219 family protein [Yersinia enterocolitica]